MFAATTNRSIRIASIVLACLAVVGGCQKRQPMAVNGSSAATETADATAAPPADQPGTEQVGALAKVLAMWQKGMKQEAIALFVNTNWSSVEKPFEGSVLAVPDGQFSLADEYWTLMGQQSAEASQLDALAMAVEQRGAKAEADGDAQTAKRCYDAMRQFSDRASADQKVSSMLQLRAAGIAGRASACNFHLNWTQTVKPSQRP